MKWSIHFKLVKALIFLSLGLFLLVFGEDYFELKKAWLKVLIGLLFLFSILRLFEWYNDCKSILKKDNEKLPE